MARKIFTYGISVILAAGLTLAALLALVEGTIEVVSISSLPLRILALLADIAVGIFLLVGCMWIATRLAVGLLGVGDEEFPPIPQDHSEEVPPKN